MCASVCLLHLIHDSLWAEMGAFYQQQLEQNLVKVREFSGFLYKQQCTSINPHKAGSTVEQSVHWKQPAWPALLARYCEILQPLPFPL